MWHKKWTGHPRVVGQNQTNNWNVRGEEKGKAAQEWVFKERRAENFPKLQMN